MFYSWLVDEDAAALALEKERCDPVARDDALPSCYSAMDAIGLFNKPSHLRSPSICLFPDF
jgi:hypothetical protein